MRIFFWVYTNFLFCQDPITGKFRQKSEDLNVKSTYMKKVYLQAPEIPKSWVSEAISALSEKICDLKAGFFLNFWGKWALE